MNDFFINLKSIFKLLILIFFAASLTACGFKKFDCPYNDGIYCKSLSEVNEMIDRGEHNKKYAKKKKKTKEGFINKCQTIPEFSPIATSTVREPIRVPEKIIRIWLAPYESTDGTFHQQTFINTVVKPAHWVES